MPRFSIEFLPAAEKQLARLELPIRNRIKKAISALADAPFPPGVKRLNSDVDLWRIRVGDYRIVYTIESGRVVVTIVRIGHRREIYR